MNKVLLVDDDELIVEIYRKRLAQHGYEVEVALDGLAAMKRLHELHPAVIVLDMMMPKFSGLEVLQFIRSQPELAATRIVVLSNYYADHSDRERITQRADAQFAKATCTPAKLIDAIARLTGGAGGGSTAPVATAVSPPPPPSHPSPPPPAWTAIVAPAPRHEAGDDSGENKMRHEFLRDAPKTMAVLHQLHVAFARDQSPSARDLHLLDFYRKVHYVTALAGMAQCADIALLCSALEALLLELHERPQSLGPSPLQTISATLAFLERLFAAAEHAAVTAQNGGTALVVDDDAISARAMSMALNRAGFKVASFNDSAAALAAATKAAYDLALLDLVMPGMDGLELCQKLRALPAYQHTPIIFVTGDVEFQARADSLLQSGDDLIAKPVMALEVAVKAVTHLLRLRLSGAVPPG